MTKAKKVIKRLKEKNKAVTIEITGNRANQIDGFSILLLSTNITSYKKNVYVSIGKKVINLLDEAGIKYKVIE